MKFDKWFQGADTFMKKGQRPRKFYRGQTRPFQDGKKMDTRLEMPSFTDSKEVATIYATRNGDFVDGSQLMTAYINCKNPLKINYATYTLYDLLNRLDYGKKNGITDDEVAQILAFLTNRKMAAIRRGAFGAAMPKKLLKFAKMPNFRYQVVNEEDTDDFDEDEVDYPIELDTLSFTRTGLHEVYDVWTDAWEPDVRQRVSFLLMVDTFALVETPTTKKVMERLGYDGVIHKDVFDGADDAAQQVFDKDAEELEGIWYGEEEYLFDEMSHENTHWTVRPFSEDQIWPVEIVEFEED